MKVRMVDWVPGLKNLPSWFKGGEDIELTWEKIAELYETGLNVMIVHSGKDHVLFVDEKRFSQR